MGKKYTSIFLALILVISGLHLYYSRKSYTWIKRKQYRRMEFSYDALSYSSPENNKGIPIYLPDQLKNVAFADKKGIVLDVKTVKLNDVAAPYNASIVENREGNYYLFFRKDVLKEEPIINPNLPFETYIGVAELDRDFNHLNRCHWIETGSHYSEDPRAFWVGDSLFVSYNDLLSSPIYSRSMFLAEVDPGRHFQVKYITDYNQHIQLIEKNWVPFSVNDQPYFTYQMTPHKVMKVKNTTSNQLEHLITPSNESLFHTHWVKKWGKLRGGTPAQKVDGEMLAFFHSAFRDHLTNTMWYVMGAYTFEAEPPFRIKSISKAPILFKGIYDTPHTNGANRFLRCIFPSGFVRESREEKEVFHVSCGENDCATKIVTIDKEELMKNMIPVDYKKLKDEQYIALEVLH